jgi:hypothetical protein
MFEARNECLVHLLDFEGHKQFVEAGRRRTTHLKNVKVDLAVENDVLEAILNMSLIIVE